MSWITAIARHLRRARALSSHVGPDRFSAPDVRTLPALAMDARVRQYADRRRWSADARQEFEEYLWTLVAMGASCRGVARHLNSQGLRTQWRKLWSARTVEYYLRTSLPAADRNLATIRELRRGGAASQRVGRRQLAPKPSARFGSLDPMKWPSLRKLRWIGARICAIRALGCRTAAPRRRL